MGCLTKTYVLVATSVPLYSPVGGLFQGGHLKEAQSQKGGKEGTTTQRPTEQGGLQQAADQGSANNSPSLYPGNSVIKLTA